MSNVEVFKSDEGFAVRVTYRDPFEYFFEIAVHVARFESGRDAIFLAERVRAKIKEIGLSKSISCILDPQHWNYSSSAYEGRMKVHNPLKIVKPSARALHEEATYD
jgi:hypothetical protein